MTEQASAAALQRDLHTCGLVCDPADVRAFATSAWLRVPENWPGC
jgi:hypothetical protein